MTGSSITGSLGTGRIYGDHIALFASTLTNDAETVDGRTHAPVIVARNRLDIGATTLINREHALLFSAGDLAIGGALDATHQATGQGASLTNQSATTEALGSLDLAMGQITNSNAHLATRLETLGSEYIVQYQGVGSPTLYREGTPGVYIHNDESDQLRTPEGNFETWLAYRYTRSSSETRIVTNDPAHLLSGAGMRLRANSLVNDNSQIIAGGTFGTRTSTGPTAVST